MIDIGQLDILSDPHLHPLMLGALVLAFIPSSHVNAIRNVRCLISGLAFLVSLLLALAFDKEQAGFQFVQQADWISFFGIQIQGRSGRHLAGRWCC